MGFVNNDPIIWTMLNAIKQLKVENDQLKARIEKLEQNAALPADRKSSGPFARHFNTTAD